MLTPKVGWVPLAPHLIPLIGKEITEPNSPEGIASRIAFEVWLETKNDWSNRGNHIISREKLAALIAAAIEKERVARAPSEGDIARAREIADAFFGAASIPGGIIRDDRTPSDVREWRDRIAHDIAKALAEMRAETIERCAEVAKGFDVTRGYTIATAILALKGEET